MAYVMQTLSQALVDISGLDPAEITPEKHIFEDLGVDSLDFLDVTFELDQALDTKLPIEDWMAEADGGAEMFVVGRFVARVERFLREGASQEPSPRVA